MKDVVIGSFGITKFVYVCTYHNYRQQFIELAKAKGAIIFSSVRMKNSARHKISTADRKNERKSEKKNLEFFP